MKVHEIFSELNRTHKFFSITFERRTTRRNNTAMAGEMRTLLCRTGVGIHKRGDILADQERIAEDFRCAVLTVWSMDVYMQNRKQNLPPAEAGRRAWRRIDLTKIQQCSAIHQHELPPVMVANLHDIKNGYRLANMPPIVED